VGVTKAYNMLKYNDKYNYFYNIICIINGIIHGIFGLHSDSLFKQEWRDLGL